MDIYYMVYIGLAFFSLTYMAYRRQLKLAVISSRK